MLDLQGCACDPLLLAFVANLKKPCVQYCLEVGLTVVNSTFEQFDPVGVTGVVLLAESHLAIHTWPENAYVSLDVYVCDYTESNQHKGEELIGRMLELLKPATVHRIATPRGRPDNVPTYKYLERLTNDFGYWIEATPVLETVQTPYQTMQILNSKTFGNILRLDGSFQCSEADECFYHEPLVHMALTHHSEALDIVIIGGGDGGAARQVLSYVNVATLTHVEIDREVVEASSRYLMGPECEKAGTRRNMAALQEDARYHLHIANGAKYINERVASIQRHQSRSCDVLILDLTDQGGPSDSLYTIQFLSQCHEILGESGVMTLHLAAPWFQTARCRELIMRLREVFDQVVPFITCVPISGGQWLMALCGNHPAELRRTADQIDEKLASVDGPPLKIVNGQNLNAMKVLPPYLHQVLSEK